MQPITRWMMLLTLAVSGVAAPAQAQGTVEYYHVDALGSVRAVTDQRGAVVRRHDYFPFGEEYLAQPGRDRRRFTGQERDAETGLDAFGARYYASRTGRFTTVDPGHVGGNLFDPQSWNAYAYARNNPLRFIDPTGTDYEINIEGGSPFWFEGGPINEFGQLKAWAAGYEFRGGMWGGTIYNAAGLPVGTYTYADKIVHLASDITGRTAGVVEAIGVAVTAVEFGLAVTNPIASTAANCVAGGCSGAGIVGMAMALSPKATKILGGLGPLASKTVAQVIRLRGGGGSQINKVATELQNLPLGAVAERAARGDEAAKTAIKVAKEAKRLGEKY